MGPDGATERQLSGATEIQFDKTTRGLLILVSKKIKMPVWQPIVNNFSINNYFTLPYSNNYSQSMHIAREQSFAARVKARILRLVFGIGN